jgi:hypothetical protein
MKKCKGLGRWLAISITFVFLTALALPLLSPLAVEAAPPNTPTNLLPTPGQPGISVTPTLSASSFSDPDSGDTQFASQWQITTVLGNYASPVFDSGEDINPLDFASITIPSGKRLGYSTTYYWHVGYWDSTHTFSGWSTETSFTTMAAAGPNQPINVLPTDGTTVSLTPTLLSSPYSNTESNPQLAAQWQVSIIPNTYPTPADTLQNVPLLPSSATTLTVGNGSTFKVGETLKIENEQVYVEAVNGNILTVDRGQNGTIPADHIQATPTIAIYIYLTPVFDTGADITNLGADTTNLTQITIPAGILSVSITYYWHVRYLDNYGNWSIWSINTSFITATLGPPNTPSNLSPVNGATSVVLAPTLQSSAFVSSYVGVHAASQWQISRTTGNYSPSYLAFDSGVVTIKDTLVLTQIDIPSGVLSVNTTYYWHVRYQDDKGNWSSWSVETSFKTIVSGNPGVPINMSPVNGATGVALTPTLQSSAFVSPDGGATHNASQWQITTTSGYYTPPAKIFDSDVDTVNLVQIDVPSGLLSVNTTYYWRVRHQDSYLNRSDWSAEVHFTTTPMQIPVTPSNISPANGAVGVSLTPTLTGSAFSDPDVGDSHKASRWQIRTSSGSYASPAYDSGLDTINKTSISIPSGKLSYNTAYYWHVRYQDSYGNWSGWSTETSFTTAPSGAPHTPINVSPANSTTDIMLTPTLQSSPFSDPDPVDTHYASQWQITTTLGSYTPPAKIFDSGVDTAHLTQIAITSGVLSVDTTYYWRVRHQDSYGNWSSWSTETSFTTTAMQVPVTPSNISLANGATGTSVTPTLTSSSFSDPDVGDSHKASQWQIREATAPSDYSTTVYDSLTDIINKTAITVPSGKLSYNTTYYWHVRYQDSHGNWSGWSTETSFSTAPSGAPHTPINVSPANSTTGIILTPTLRVSDFSDDDPGDTHYASQWQIRTGAETFDSPMFDSGVDSSNLTQIAMPSGYLEYGTTYYWRVRHQDSYGNWSGWSAVTFFTTAIPRSPNQPTTISPSSGTTGISLTPTLRSSLFSARDEGDSHRASQWQIRTESGTYDSPAFDSGTDTVNLTRITIPAGRLDYGITYYWRVRYQNRYGSWSAYSVESLFSTIMPPPQQPVAISPSNGAVAIILTPTLQSSIFVSAGVGAMHAASQWQITATSGDYSSPVYDSGTDTIDKTSITVPSWVLSESTTYYWRVRYQDNFGNWSDYSLQVSFTTATSPTGDFSVAPTQAVPGQTVTFTDTSTGDVTSWLWDFGDGTTAEWTTIDRPEDGKITHRYPTLGNYTVTLKVVGPIGENTKTKVVTVRAPAPAPSGGKGFPWVPVVVGIAVVLAGGGVFWYLRRR